MVNNIMYVFNDLKNEGDENRNSMVSFAFSRSVLLVQIVEKLSHRNFIHLTMIIFVEHVMKHVFLVNAVANVDQ